MALAKGEKRWQILQTLAEMLEAPVAEKMTTAAIAARLNCSEAALYRHFASKASMYDGLIEFIESSLLGLVNQIIEHEVSVVSQALAMVQMALTFAEKNRGMARVMVGDALVGENPRLQKRMSLIVDKWELSLKQALKLGQGRGEIAPGTDCAALAHVLRCYLTGAWSCYVRSEFRHKPMANWEGERLAIATLLTAYAAEERRS